VRSVATDVLVFAGVNPDDAVQAVSNGRLEQRIAAPAPTADAAQAGVATRTTSTEQLA
jgi:hypothetical protein